MKRTFLIGLSFLLSLILAGGAFRIWVNCILPWWKAPQTTHVTVILAGIQFAGRQVFIPLAIFSLAALATALMAIRLLKKRNDS
jgi:hypothetical protein